MRPLQSQPRVVRPSTGWTLRDVLIVSGMLLGIIILWFGIIRGVMGETRLSTGLALYGVHLFMLFLPMLWIQRRCGCPPEDLGLRRGKLGSLLSVSLGIAAALVYYLSVRLALFPSSARVHTKQSYLALLLVPVSLQGIGSIVLAPIGEEVFFRGFIFSYLRSALGRGPALLAQALLFSAAHLGPSQYDKMSIAVDAFLIGLMLGVLFDRTESLSSSIICHSTMNYINLARRILGTG